MAKRDPFAKALGLTLRTLRKLRGYKVAEVVKATGISGASLSAWECGKYYPTICKLHTLTDLYRVQLSTVITNAEKLIVRQTKKGDRDD